MLLLVAGFICIRRRLITAHRRCMMGAFGASTLFLALYLTHKILKVAQGEPLHTTFNHTGPIKLCYMVILLSHLVLAATIPFLAIRLIKLGLKRQDRRHRRLARVAWPLWLYVSATGILIYLMLYHWNPPPDGATMAGL